jgi:hypothetical protein
MVKLPMKMKFKEHEIKIFNLYKGTKFWYVLIFVLSMPSITPPMQFYQRYKLIFTFIHVHDCLWKNIDDPEPLFSVTLKK